MATGRMDLFYMLEETINSMENRRFSEQLMLKKAQKKENRYRELQELIDSTAPEKTFFDILDEWLKVKGYTKLDGSADYALFYKRARITRSTWSNLRVWSADDTGNQPSKETLLKIVLALRLTVQEADQLMSRASNRLNYNDFRDRVIMACMYKKIYAPEDVYEILEYFSYKDGKTRRFKNIYGEAD